MSLATFDAVLDTSVVLAVLKGERGADLARKRIERGAVSVVNLAEIVTKLVEWDVPEAAARNSIAELGLKYLQFDEHLAFQAGLLHRFTKGGNISLGDRACLVTARHFGVPAVTADRAWANLNLGIAVELVR